MAVPINRRAFLKGASSITAALLGAPLISSSRAGAAGDRLVVSGESRRRSHGVPVSRKRPCGIACMTR